MHTMPELKVFVTVGVDTHKDVHVAVALDQLGRFLDATEIPTTSAGYAELLGWASDLGTVDKVGIDGTGSHGAGLCRWLTARGVIVVEVDRSDRRLRRNKGKSDTIVEDTAPALVARRGIGTHTAATLLVTAGDNPDRLRSEASFAALAGTSPLEASSGARIRHRLNRGGDRDANAALHMIAVNRLANGHEPTRAYVRKRTGGDKADLDTLRRIKRYIAREVFPLLRDAITRRPKAVPRAA